MHHSRFEPQRQFTGKTSLFWMLPLALGVTITASAATPTAVAYAPSREAFEDEPFLRFYIQRDGGDGIAQSVAYFTQDETATAGVHYLPVSGTASFAAGQTTVSVDVPLIDNGQVDGERHFRLRLTNASSGLDITAWDPPPGAPPPIMGCASYQLGVIKDNELRPTLLDPTFVPDMAAFSVVLPDDRILFGPTMLRSNGWVDISFVAGGTSAEAQFNPLHVYPDGRVLSWYGASTQAEPRLVRLLPNGQIAQVLDASVPQQSQFLGVQPGGKLLMASWVMQGGWVSYYQLFRLNEDGSRDTTFNEAAIKPAEILGMEIQTDGKIIGTILVARGDGFADSKLVRLNSDGTLDSSFSVEGEVGEAFLRRSGKIVVKRRRITPRTDWEIVQINPDATLDTAFQWGPLFAGGTSLHTWAEQPDGRIIIPYEGGLRRLNVDGSADPDFAPNIPSAPCSDAGSIAPTRPLALTGSGQVLFVGHFDTVDGFPTRGFVRLREGPPQPEFRLYSQPECYRSDDVVLIRVVRTGETTAGASVDLSTADDTARAGADYTSKVGTVDFAPLQNSQEVAVPLSGKTRILDRLRFYVRLSNPSAGYAVVSPIPVVIWPELRITTEKLRSDQKLTLHGTIPGLRYRLNWSTDLGRWADSWPVKATSETLEFPVIPGGSPTEFYRVRRDL